MSVPPSDSADAASQVAAEVPAGAPSPWPLKWLRSLGGDAFFMSLLGLLMVLTAWAPERLHSYPTLVDWPTIAALAGLLVLTQGVESSGALHRLGVWMIGFMATQRATAVCLVLAAALLSMGLTNDVALFVVVPLTLSVCRMAQTPATQLIIFEALAVNAGSALTPIGNPQNLFLWQRSGVSFGQFVGQMLPLVLVLMALLLVVTWFAFPARPMQVRSDAAEPTLDKPLLVVSLLLYLPFLIATELKHAAWALVAVGAAMLLLRPRVLTRVDGGLLLVFVLMFIDLRLVAGLATVRDAIAGLSLDQPQHLFWAGIAASQWVSNVPAAIALAEYSKDWRIMAWAVNIGGFGFMVGSLANLIALRLAADRAAWWRFHLYSLPFLLAAAVVGWLMLFA